MVTVNKCRLKQTGKDDAGLSRQVFPDSLSSKEVCHLESEATSTFIRRARPEDLPGVRKLLLQVNQIHADGRPDLFKAGGIKYQDAELLDIFQDDTRPVFVCVNAGSTVLGYAFCIFEQTKETASLRPVRTLYLDDLCVDETARGQHIGRRLYNHVVDFARQQGFDRVTLHAWNFNRDAFGFYEKLGMTPLVTTMEHRLR